MKLMLDCGHLRIERVREIARYRAYEVDKPANCDSEYRKHGSSDDFEPQQYESNIRCITSRFFKEATHPQFTSLSHIFVFGEKARLALQQVTMTDGTSVWRALEDHGRRMVCLPHPSGQNGEYVRLAKFAADQFPTEDVYLSMKWAEFGQAAQER